MWGSSEEPPGTMEAGPPPDSVTNLKQTCEQSKNQLESVKDIMLKNKESLKKKEEELQEYAKKLSKFKIRAKRSNRSNRDDIKSSSDFTSKSKSDAISLDVTQDAVHDISQATTPIAKSSLLQKKLAEDRKIFEQRSKELTESKKAAEEKVEALRQKIEEQHTPLTSALVASQTIHPVTELSHVQDKDHKIIELSNKILDLEATIIDLQENLKEKDSVIDSKTKAVTLMSADLSRKGKTTLDTLEDTKDEMRSMQENFVLVEESLRSKNDNLLSQLKEKTSQLSALEENIQSLTVQMEIQKQAEIVGANFSRSTMDTLADTKDAMKSMQENFILIETSLKEKNDHLLKQLEEREIKLAEAEAKILHLESGLGIERQPNTEDLMYKIEKLEQENRNLQDEKYELQKNISDLQNQIITNETINNDAALSEKDNMITELKSLIEELKKSYQDQEEQLNAKNEDIASKVIELEKQVIELETQKDELSVKLTTVESEALKDDDRVQKLTKELDELNKSMIKLKAQHKNKLKNLQKQLKNFEKVSDTNAELVKLTNQITLLEEEKGNLQLSLVDFDELKALAGEWQERIRDLEGKVSAQTKEIEAHIESIAILENQKLDLMQELHAVRQEVSSLEAENAESENSRVTAEMKVVDLEEQLETWQKQSSEDPERAEMQRQLESLKEENERLSQKVLKLEEQKPSSDVGSTESFVKTGSNVDSTESFEALNADADRADLLRKIDGLTRENGALLEKLTRYEEKGSSDTGSTESFERIPDQNEMTSRLENLTRENFELIMKVTKLEEKLALKETDKPEIVEEEVKVREVRSVDARELQLEQEVEAPTSQVTAVEEESTQVEELLAKICSLAALNENLTSSLNELEKEKAELVARLVESPEKAVAENVEESPVEEAPVKAEKITAEEDTPVVESPPLVDDDKPRDTDAHESSKIEEKKSNEAELAAIAALESEIARCNALINEQKDTIEDLHYKVTALEEELSRKSVQIENDSMTCTEDITQLRRELEESEHAIAEWKTRCSTTEKNLLALEQNKEQIELGFKTLQDERKKLLEEAEHKDALVNSLREELDATITNLEEKLKEQTDAASSQEELIHELRDSIENKERELQAKYAQLQSDLVKMDELQKEMNELEVKLQQRDTTVASMTEELEALRTNSSLVEEDLFVARHQLFQLQNKLENSKTVEEYEQVTEELKNKQLLVVELEGKLVQRVAEINVLQGQTEAFRAENEQLRQQLQEKDHKAADLLETNRSLEEALQNAERARADVKNQFSELRTLHEECECQLSSKSDELRDVYKLMEQLKIKHTDDIDNLNRRLEDSLEELQQKAQDIESLQTDLNEKNSIIAGSISEEVKSGLETQVAELKKKQSEAEEKLQAQLEKMKKYAAVAKKKTAEVEDLKIKIKELEEKYTLEKSEKDEKIDESQQQSLMYIQEKDNRLTVIEEELRHAQAARDEALNYVEVTKAELDEAKQKLNALQDELHEMNEIKERARELGVRMEVMEKEYVDQLAQINSLKTENGLLLSKQAQINERLENVEKESEERRASLEKLEKEKEIEETRKSEAQELCTQCSSRVQALEAKLQERDAEIENLDNELHNSIGNLVQMQENLRLSTIGAATDNSLQESYNELMGQFSALTATNEATRAKYEAALKENHELSERVAHLHELNTTLQARIEVLEQEIAKDNEVAASFKSSHEQYVELLERFERQKSEFEISQSELHQALANSEVAQRALQGRIEQLEQDKYNLVQDLQNLKNTQQHVVMDESWGLEPTSSAFDIEAVPQQQIETAERQKREANLDETPPLFDASVFGAPPSQSANAELELEIRRLKEEVSVLYKQVDEGKLTSESMEVHLNAEIQQAKTSIESLTAELNTLSTARVHLETALAAKDAKVVSLQNEVKVANEALAAVKADYEKLSEELEHKNAWIISKTNEMESNLGQLEHLTLEKQEVERAVKNLLFGTSGVDDSLSLVEKLQSFEITYRGLLSELEAVTNENQELLAVQEVYKNKIIHLEMESKTSGDNAVITDLESRIAQVVSERDILQLQVNDVTRLYEDLKENSEVLKNLQSQLDIVSHERNQLLREIEALRANQEHYVEKREVHQAETVPVRKVEDLTSESMWEDDEDPWGFNDKATSAEHVDIPIVPSTEIQLRLKVDELEEKLKELTDENGKLIQEGKLAQVKNVKYVKKLKEYKVQFDSLQHELKSQKSIGGFGGLDSAIEDELKAQITNLEKVLSEAKEENKKLAAEKENLLKRIDVLTAAIERFTETKEKQDMEVHIWQMRYKELELKVQQLDFGPETRDSTCSPPQQSSTDSNPQYEAEIKELKESLDALAAENDELQHLLEEHRAKRQASEKENGSQLQELQTRNTELSTSNDKLKADYDTLRKQYEQSLMDANDQVQNMRQNCELLKAELAEKIAESEEALIELNEKLSEVKGVKAQLEAKVQELEQSLTNANDEVEKSRDQAVGLGRELAEKSKELEVTSAELLGKLQTALEEKAQLEINVQSLEACVGKLNSTSSSLDEITQLVNTRAEQVASLQEEMKRVEAEKAQLQESTKLTVQQLMDTLNEKQSQLDELSAAITTKDDELSRQRAELEELRGAVDKIKGLELSIEDYVTEVQEKNEKINELQGKLSSFEIALNDKNQQVSTQQSQLQQFATEIQQCTLQVQDQQELINRLAESEKRVDELNAIVAERETNLERSTQEIDQLRFDLQSKITELEEVKSKLESLVQEQSVSVQKEVVGVQEAPKEEEVPVFTFGSDSIADQELKKLKDELKSKNEEIEHLLYSLNEAKTTRMIQELQDNVNALYNEKSYLEEQIIVKNQEIHALKTQLEGRQTLQSSHERRKRSLGDQEEIMKLQNELHSRDQQINDLRYVLVEKEAQLKAALPAAEDAEMKLHELHDNYRKLESYKFAIDELQAEVANLRGLKRLAAEDKAIIERLNSEKETIRQEAEEAIKLLLKDKEAEIDKIKIQLADENQRLIAELGLRERDLENLKVEIQGLHNCEQENNNLKAQLDQMAESRNSFVEQQLASLHIEISERDRRVAELNITKDAEMHNMQVQLNEKNAKIEELTTLSKKAEGDLVHLKKMLEIREAQINGLMHQLDEKSKEYELIRNALQRHVSQTEQSAEVAQQQESSEVVPGETERELDLALYMLHQRDVRCEELALELTQLVDERDTLQLRLSNSLRVNEELKKYTDSREPLQVLSTSHVETEPLVENPSPSKSEGPVEIAKEAIDSPIGEDKKALALKLSQLRSIDQRRDVRLKDDREQRHSQQMMLMTHMNILDKLPPEAASRLVNANYTLSRDVQSQSSVLMNWLWGKSTPKVMHM